MAARHSAVYVCFAAPESASNTAAAIKASLIFQGSPGRPRMFFNFFSYNAHVEGMNWAGPIAPPYPPTDAIGQETGVLEGSLPKSPVMRRKGCRSPEDVMTFGTPFPVFMLIPPPVVVSVI